MAAEDEVWDRLLAGLRAGDSAAEHDFWRLYGTPLERVAERRLSPQLQARVGPEDVALSACRTFMRRARLGEFLVPDAAALWKLLCVITLTKAREQARYHSRHKRSIAQEVRLDRGSADNDGIDLADPRSERSEAEDVAEQLADQMALLIQSLDPEEQRVVDLKLQDFTNERVATELGCSERTVRRILKRVQDQMQAGSQA